MSQADPASQNPPLTSEPIAASSDPTRLARDVEYLRQAVSLHQPTLGNVLKNVRHRLNLLCEWWLGGIVSELRRHRLRKTAWFWEFPPPGLLRIVGDEVDLCGTIRDTDGRAPVEIFIRFCGWRAPLRIRRRPMADGHVFDDVIRLPHGFAFLRLSARLDCGVTIPLGFRLVFNPPPRRQYFWQRRKYHSDLPVVLSYHPPRPENIALRPAAEPLVSIVIPVYGQTPFTLRCLAAIARFSADFDYEVIVVDDCSPAAKVAGLERVRSLRLHRNAENLGFIRSCNQGARLARGRYVVLLNNDTEVQRGWLVALLAVFQHDSAAGLVGARLVYPDGTLQEAGGICWRDGSAWNYGRDRDPTYPEFTFLRETDYCSGACLMLPMDLWRELGGFDECYAPAYYEDTDLAFRVRAAGRKVYYQPKAIVVHHEGKSNGTDTTGGVKAYQVRNQQIFFERWKDTLASHQPNGERVFRARERSFGRKIILVIDHYVPWPDKDAGSRNMMAYLRFFLESGYVVKFIGDNHAAHQPYTDQLERLGIEVLVGPHFKDHWPEWLAVNGPEIDYVFLSRAHTAKRWLEPLRQHTRASLLFYGHDLLSRTLRRAYKQFGDLAQLEASEEIHALERDVFAAVDWIFYPSADEVACLRAEFPHYQIERLPLYTFGEPDRAVPGFEDRRGLLFVGGFGHPPNADAMLWFVREAMPELRRLCPGIRLTIVGSNPSPEIIALAADDVALRSDVPEAELVELYRRHRLAIAPLRMGGGIKGKILEAMFLGTPAVTTPIGAEGLGWSEPHLATTPEADFARAVAALHDDPIHWQQLQANAWRFLAEEYSAECLREALAPAFMSSTASPP